MKPNTEFTLIFTPSTFRRLETEAAETGKTLEEYIVCLLTAAAEKEASRKGGEQ